jgi:hypothetical protein
MLPSGNSPALLLASTATGQRIRDLPIKLDKLQV